MWSKSDYSIWNKEKNKQVHLQGDQISRDLLFPSIVVVYNQNVSGCRSFIFLHLTIPVKLNDPTRLLWKWAVMGRVNDPAPVWKWHCKHKFSQRDAVCNGRWKYDKMCKWKWEEKLKILWFPRIKTYTVQKKQNIFSKESSKIRNFKTHI